MTRWFRPRNEKRWVSVSEDGYYAIGPRRMDLTDGPYEAFHIAALWASPERIGLGAEITDAQRICDEHRERNGAPA